MNEPMITDRSIREEGVRRFACPAEYAPISQRLPAPHQPPRLPLLRRIAALFG